MNAAKVNAIVATSYNLFFGKKENKVMTPAAAAKISKGDKAALLKILSERGGSDLYSKEDAYEAFVKVVS